MEVSKESIGKNLIENRFHVKLRICSPEICKQSLQVKSWKTKVKAEKANKLKAKMNKPENKLRNHNILTNLLTPSTQSATNKNWN